jgi:hypothetical protein
MPDLELQMSVYTKRIYAKVPLWTKFLLLFRRTNQTTGQTEGTVCTIYWKHLFKRIYVLKEEFKPKGNSHGQRK